MGAEETWLRMYRVKRVLEGLVKNPEEYQYLRRACEEDLSWELVWFTHN